MPRSLAACARMNAPMRIALFITFLVLMKPSGKRFCCAKASSWSCVAAASRPSALHVCPPSTNCTLRRILKPKTSIISARFIFKRFQFRIQILLLRPLPQRRIPLDRVSSRPAWPPKNGSAVLRSLHRWLPDIWIVRLDDIQRFLTGTHLRWPSAPLHRSRRLNLLRAHNACHCRA